MLAANTSQLMMPARRGLVALSKKEAVIAFLVASTGFDLLQIRIGDNGVRFAYAIYLFLFIALFRHMRFPRLQTVLFTLFCAGAFVGMLLLGTSLHSILYIIWAVFSYGIIFPLFYYFGREHRDAFLAGIVLAGRAQILLGVLFIAVHLQHRAALFYYEPSYFAYGLAPYCTIVIWHLVRRLPGSRRFDCALILLAVLETGSATLLLILALIWLLAAIVNGVTWKQAARYGFAGVAVIGGLVLYAQFAHDLTAYTINQVFRSGDVVNALVTRGGNRVPRLLGAAYIYRLHPWLGVGIGQYRVVSSHVNLSRFSHGQAWLSAQNNEAINIYVELLVTTGTPTACLFFLFLLRTVTLRKVRVLDDQQKCIFISLVALLIMLDFEANYLRPYLWMLLGAYTGIVREPTPRRNLSLREPFAVPLLSQLSAGRSAAAPSAAAAE